MAGRSKTALELPVIQLKLRPRGSTSDMVYEALLEAILVRQLRAGTPLIESQLAERFGVSTIPVREALQRLAHSGLVDAEYGRGAAVHKLTIDEVHDVFEMRLIIEPLALRQSAPRLTTEDLTRLGKLLKQAQAATRDHNYGEMSKLNYAFHVLLYHSAKNQLLLKWLEGLSEKFRMIAMYGWGLDEDSQLDWEEHNAILEAIRQGNVPLAADHLVRHITRFNEAVIARMRSGVEPSGDHLSHPGDEALELGRRATNGASTSPS